MPSQRSLLLPSSHRCLTRFSLLPLSSSPTQDRPFDLESGALLDDNAKARRAGGAGVRGRISRNLARATQAALSIVYHFAYKRWLTTILVVWVIFRELAPSSGGAHKYSYKYDPIMQHNVDKGSLESTAYPYASIEDLIIVCGHAVYLSSDYLKAGEEESWYLEEYQKRKGQANTFVEQMRFGVREAAQNPSSLLLFSGGKTRREAGSISEGLSYWEVSRAFGWFGEEGTEERAFTEEFARDSFENVLFSIARFKELTGHPPRNITVVGYEFKRERFVGLHRTAIQFPSDRFNYIGGALLYQTLIALSLSTRTYTLSLVGTDQAVIHACQATTLRRGTPAVHEEESAKGEVEVRRAFSHDPYGCRGALRKKRESRDPFNVGQPYLCSNPELRGLMTHCGASRYKGKLPW